ncbi:MAG: putative ABC exporter domain-containing protein [Lachnospiraceae bacterium]|jgi:hypothetical protein|nr:putative ABC exporter domain-containing protein [Lachnospiraceae bacterium]
MNALLYVIRKRLKNSFIETIHNPGRLILSLILIGLIGFTVVTSAITGMSKQSLYSFNSMIFALIVFALVTLYFGIYIKTSFASGDSIFDMSDVNIMFTAPVKPQLIMVYGVSNMLKTAFVAAFFILFQASTLKDLGVNFGGLLITVAVFILTILLMSILSIVIYSNLKNSNKRKAVVVVISIAIFIPAVVAFLSNFLGGADPLDALTSLAKSNLFYATPIAGWSAGATYFLVFKEYAKGFIYLGLIIACTIGLFVFYMKTNVDYFEDVLVASETSFEKKRAVSEGNINSLDIATTGKVKVRGTGIKGFGAKTFFYKHMRETFRANKFGVFGVSSIMYVAIAVVYGFLGKGEAGLERVMIVTLLGFMIFMQLFMVGQGRGLKELYSHFIFMVPESSFKKIVWSNLEVVVKAFGEALVSFAIVGVICKANIFMIVFSIIAFCTYTLLLVSINYLFMKWSGVEVNSGLLMIIYSLIAMLIIAPGVVLGFVVGFLFSGGLGAAFAMTMGILVFAAWCLVISFVLFAMSRGALDNSDIQVMPSSK